MILKYKRLKPRDLYYTLMSALVLILCIVNPFSGYKIYSLLLVLTYFYIFILTLRYKNFSLYQIFLITYFVFLTSRPFLDLVGLFDVRTLDFFYTTYMDDALASKTIRVVTCFLVGTSYAWILSDRSFEEPYFVKSSSEKQALNKVLEILFYIYVVIFALKLLYTIRLVRSMSYLAIFDGSIENIKYPVIFSGAGTIIEILYLLLVYYNRDKKSFIKYSILYMGVGIIKMFTGQRTTTFLFFLFIIYMYSKYYSEIKIYSKKVILLALSAPFVIEIIAQIRIGQFSIENLFKNNLLFLLLKNMGVSINVIAYLIQYQGTFTNKVPFLIGYFFDFFQSEPAGQTLVDIEKGNYLGDHLSYRISQTAFLSGRGTGTSIVAESYDFCQGNLFLMVLIAFIITFFVLKICNKGYKNIYAFVLAYFTAMDFIYSPRWSVFKSLQKVAIAIFVCFVVARFASRKGDIQVLEGGVKL